MISVAVSFIIYRRNVEEDLVVGFRVKASEGHSQRREHPSATKTKTL